MSRSALPKDYVIGPDNQSWLMKLKKRVQIWLAAGPRVPSGFFKWRDIPRTLLAVKGKGLWRLENSDGTYFKDDPTHCFFNEFFWRISESSKNKRIGEGFYLSRIQPWSRWGIIFQWPLFFNCWFIYRKQDVISPPRYKSDFGITKMFTFGIGFKRDADKVYWLTCNGFGNFE